jgi:hypothetical protein
VAGFGIIATMLAACVDSPKLESQGPLGSVSRTPVVTGHARFVPNFVAFWTSQDGIAGGARCSPDECLGAIAVTGDGGGHWEVTLRTTASVVVGGVVGRTFAWAAPKCSHGDCRVWTSRDAGHVWSSMAVGSHEPLQFFEAGLAFGIGDVRTWHGLVVSSDAGGHWLALADPCRGNTSSVVAVSFVSRVQGWAYCHGDGAGGSESKAVFRTVDGGQSWVGLARALLGEPGRGLRSRGSPQGIDMLNGAVGWIWNTLTGPFLLETEDGGASWTPLSVGGQVSGIISADRITRAVGFALRRGHGYDLLLTIDAGRSWESVHHWSV